MSKMAGSIQAARYSMPMRAIHSVSYTHLRAHETPEHLVCRLLLEKKKKKKKQKKKKKKKKKKKRKKRKILCFVVCFFFFNDTATTEIYT